MLTVSSSQERLPRDSRLQTSQQEEFSLHCKVPPWEDMVLRRLLPLARLLGGRLPQRVELELQL